MAERIRPRILLKEATCPCGCGRTPSEKWLDTTNLWLELCGFPIGISTMARCPTYNRKIKGSSKSPHKLIKEDYGATDGKQRNPKKRDRMLEAARALKSLGFINHIEVCDGHIHIAKVPDNHPFAGVTHWGKSK